MIFLIYNTDRYSSKNGLLKCYPILSKYGYFGEHQYFLGVAGYIKLKSFEELLALQEDIECEIIIGREVDTPTIEIYDDYRE